MKTKLATTRLLPLVVIAAACSTTPPADDAGDVAFVHQATQTLIGRRPRGTAEVQALLGVLRKHDRGTVADVLMAESDYVERWVPVLADSMQMQRGGAFDIPTACLSAPSYLTSGTGLAEAQLLADHIRSNTPSSTQFAPNGVVKLWNLNDALRAALTVDDLHVAWRPFLFVLTKNHTKAGFSATIPQIRDNFMRTVLNTRLDCVSCHSSTYSKTEVYDGYPASTTWDRTATPGFALEVGVFGTGTVTSWPSLPGGPLFATNCAVGGCHGTTGQDWPLVNGVGAPKPLPYRVPLMTDDAIKSQILYGDDYMPDVGTGLGWDDTSPEVDEIVAFLRQVFGGYTDLPAYLDDGQFVTLHNPWGISDDCGVHWKANQVTGTRTVSFGGQKASTTDLGNIVEVLEDGLNSLPTELPAPPSTPADPDLPLPVDQRSAVAAMLVLNIADDLVEELSGSRTTVAHGLSRNVAQAEARASVVASLLVQESGYVRISLKNALKTIVQAPLYNRRSPSTVASTSSAYQLEMFLNPWAATEDGVVTSDGANKNGQGDLLGRRSPNQLLFSLSKDLGWSAPVLDPDTSTAYPTADFMKKIGRFESADSPGTTAWQLDSLLFWEQQVGACQSPSGSADYVDRLVNSAVTSSTATVRDVALAIKDRLLQEPQFTTLADGTSEETLTKSLFESTVGTGKFTALASGFSTTVKKAQLRSAARSFCGVLLTSPDYLLANVPTVTTEYAAPTLVVCLAGETVSHICTKTELAGHYCGTLIGMGLSCP